MSSADSPTGNPREESLPLNVRVSNALLMVVGSGLESRGADVGLVEGVGSIDHFRGW